MRASALAKGGEKACRSGNDSVAPPGARPEFVAYRKQADCAFQRRLDGFSNLARLFIHQECIIDSACVWVNASYQLGKK